jgi:hypothetical protein
MRGEIGAFMRPVAKRQVLAPRAAAIRNFLAHLLDDRRLDQIFVKQRHPGFLSLRLHWLRYSRLGIRNVWNDCNFAKSLETISPPNLRQALRFLWKNSLCRLDQTRAGRSSGRA